jgi:4-alpha-glucanotransferase
MFARASGVLLHPTSLPGRYGIGDLGPAAFEFIETLAAAGQRIWQVLPLTPTGYGDSPYQCFSAFAGNPLLISLERLVAQGLLDPRDVDNVSFADGAVDFESVHRHRDALWPRVLDRFEAAATPTLHAEFERFCTAEAEWLDDYALFMAIKAAHGQAAWTRWNSDIARRNPAAVAHWSARCSRSSIACASITSAVSSRRGKSRTAQPPPSEDNGWRDPGRRSSMPSPRQSAPIACPSSPRISA